MQRKRDIASGIILVLLLAGGAGCSGSGDDNATSADAPITSALPSSTIAGTTTSESSPTSHADDDGSTTSTTVTPEVSDPAPTSSGNSQNPGTWPSDLKLPDGMTVQGTPSTNGNQTTVTLTCTGKPSTALTDLTAMLNNAGYKTKWIMQGQDPDRTATLEGVGHGVTMTARINEATDGTCRSVDVSISG